MRYQIVYSKRGFPLIAWRDSEREAKDFADKFRKVGYEVTVWLHSEAGARKTDI